MILKSHLSALCSFSWLLGSSTSRSDLILILHVQSLLSVCWSILNSSLYLKTSQGDEGWYCLSPFLNFWVFKRPKRIHTPHSLFWDFWADKTFTTSWSGSRVQVQAPAYRLTITPKGFSRWQSKVLTEGWALLASTQAQFGQVLRSKGEIKHREFLSQLQLLLAVTGSLEEKVLPLLWYWLSSRVKNFLILCRYWAATCHVFCNQSLQLQPKFATQ